MSPPIFRIFNPTAPKEDPAEKRRAQLRQAQQSYRKRKSRYAKGLEEDLALSKAHEANLVLQNEKLNNCVQALLEILAVNGIAVPDGSCLDIPDFQGINSRQEASYLFPTDGTGGDGRNVRCNASPEGVHLHQRPAKYTTSALQLASPESLSEYDLQDGRKAPQHQTSNASQADEWPQFTQPLDMAPSPPIRSLAWDMFTEIPNSPRSPLAML
ncbi:hypothetical protein G7Z17_g246 [Cylindrodendrum hubeiense]|uniref:BZIP domain-containing protein n=1 Tax=Cylindrodendrum hubeiense TaxID=595255 RepID=A0A9P5HSJ1_9HYPO|nr:hypothetical protein G7Z17_g246 [Cylindrodendrum hubeiense]